MSKNKWRGKFFLAYSLRSWISSTISFGIFLSESSISFAAFAITSRNPATRFFSWTTFSWTSFIALVLTCCQQPEPPLKIETYTYIAGHYHRKTHVNNIFDEGNSHQTSSTLQDIDRFFGCFECIFFFEWHKLGRSFRYRFWLRLGAFNQWFIQWKREYIQRTLPLSPVPSSPFYASASRRDSQSRGRNP